MTQDGKRLHYALFNQKRNLLKMLGSLRNLQETLESVSEGSSDKKDAQTAVPRVSTGGSAAAVRVAGLHSSWAQDPPPGP